MNALNSNKQILSAELDQVDPSLMPPQIRELVRVIGFPDTVKLLQARGGTFFVFPIKAGGLLVNIVGVEAAKKLVAAYGGERRDLPKVDKIMIKLRDIAIDHLRKTKSVTQLAQEFNLTRRHIFNVSKKEDDNPTMDMFDYTS